MRPRLLRTDIAVKHLLHHLHDASELRLNPLAEHFFNRDRGDDGDALARVKDAVTAAIARC
ncbi:MAG TPA: hypothetical protein VFE36_14535, partial [Candidatus Baltobacteraceae bacterium]|nr:hypothetical protein [Candidatus Baltobacteraceae bacterium]